MRKVMTRVLPEPAPARMSNGPVVCSTASRCSGLSLSRKFIGGDCFQYTVRRPTSDVRRPTSDVRRPTTDDRRPTTDDRRPTPEVRSAEVRAPQIKARRVEVRGGGLRLLGAEFELASCMSKYNNVNPGQYK